jgi:hypothetical protein
MAEPVDMVIDGGYDNVYVDYRAALQTTRTAGTTMPFNGRHPAVAKPAHHSWLQPRPQQTASAKSNSLKNLIIFAKNHLMLRCQDPFFVFTQLWRSNFVPPIKKKRKYTS